MKSQKIPESLKRQNAKDSLFPEVEPNKEPETNEDYLDPTQVEVDDVVYSIRKDCEKFVAIVDRLEPGEETNFFGLNELQLGVLVARELHEVLGKLKDWEPFLVDVLIENGVPQKQISDTLGFSTNTINRWKNNPPKIKRERLTIKPSKPLENQSED